MTRSSIACFRSALFAALPAGQAWSQGGLADATLEEHIRRSGATNLPDVFRVVPGAALIGKITWRF